MTEVMNSDLMKDGRYLPEPMRDFHDQKDLFKSMQQIYGENMEKHVPSWIDAHIFTVDFFLWFMASRGYTLQKCRMKKIEFEDWPVFDTSAMDAAFYSMLENSTSAKESTQHE